MKTKLITFICLSFCLYAHSGIKPTHSNAIFTCSGVADLGHGKRTYLIEAVGNDQNDLTFFITRRLSNGHYQTQSITNEIIVKHNLISKKLKHVEFQLSKFGPQLIIELPITSFIFIDSEGFIESKQSQLNFDGKSYDFSCEASPAFWSKLVESSK